APDVLERDVPDPIDEAARLQVERLQPGVFDFVFPAHLLDEQLGIRADVDVPLAVRERPPQRGEQAVVFSDVVGRDAERAVDLVEERAAGRLDAHAVAGRARVAAGAAVDVRDDAEPHCADGVTPSAVAGVAAKYRIRRQLSHWMRRSLRRTSLKTCGRSRTWQTMQWPSRASATASPFRCRATCSKSCSAGRDSLAASASRPAPVDARSRSSVARSCSSACRTPGISATRRRAWSI